MLRATSWEFMAQAKSLLAKAAAGLVLLVAIPAVMILPARAEVTAAGTPPSIPSLPTTPTGADISFPQCGQSLPIGQAFGVVGVNFGRDNTLNPCLEQELEWAADGTSGITAQPNVSVYLNTGDPGNTYAGLPIGDWPSSGDTPYGDCLSTMAFGHLFGPGQVSTACAFEYGYQKAVQDLSWLQTATAADRLPSSARDYPVWLDVETSNTWQTATNLNLADLQAMVYALGQWGVLNVGVYATPRQWQEITGGAASPSLGPLPLIRDWILGAGSLGAAEAECHLRPFTGVSVALAQFPMGDFDGDYSC